MHRWRLVWSHAMIALALLLPAIAGAQSAPIVQLSVDSRSDLRAGGYVTLYADVTLAPDAIGQPVTATLDPKDVAPDKFVLYMTSSDFATPTLGACPADHRCFLHIVKIDVYTTPGPHAMPIAVTDAHGRTTRTSSTVLVTPPQDLDGDGLPDVWEGNYGLRYLPSLPGASDGDNGPDGDPDGDGVSNLQEYLNHTNPRAKYQRVFTEGSFGERQPLATCFTYSTLDTSIPYNETNNAPVRVLAIGDDGRSSEQFYGSGFGQATTCPLWPVAPFIADRVVAVYVESAVPLAVERVSLEDFGASGLGDGVVNASFGAQRPADRWWFGRGTANRDLGLFFLAFNPGTEPVDAVFTFNGGEGNAPARMTRTLAPGVRTTVWVNQDLPAGVAFDAATTITTTGPIYVERAYRYKAPGRTVAHDSVSRGTSDASTTWYFAASDLSASFDTSFVVFNPSSQRATLDARFLFADRDPVTKSLDVPGQTRLVVRPRELGIGGASVGLALRATNNVVVVAERTTDGSTPSGPWRQSALGVMSTGTKWVFASSTSGSNTDNEIVIANPSDDAGRARLRFNNISSYDSPFETVVDVPARRVVHISPAQLQAPAAWLVVTMEAAGSGSVPGVVVERASYARVDGVDRARQVTVAGHIMP